MLGQYTNPINFKLSYLQFLLHNVLFSPTISSRIENTLFLNDNKEVPICSFHKLITHCSC